MWGESRRFSELEKRVQLLKKVRGRRENPKKTKKKKTISGVTGASIELAKAPIREEN